MPYVKMKLPYFQKFEEFLDQSKYIKIYRDENRKIKIDIIDIDSEEVIMTSIDCKNNNILNLSHEMQTRLNNNELLFSQYKYQDMRNKTLDNVVIMCDLVIYFSRLENGYVLGTITKELDDLTSDIFIAMNETIKDTFEDLDRLIYEKFGFYPDSGTCGREKFSDYINKTNGYSRTKTK